LVPIMCRSETKTSRIILVFLKPKLEVFHKSKEPPNTSFDHGMGVGVASSTKAFLRTHNNYMVSIGSSLSFLFFLLRTSFRTNLNLNIKPTLEKFPCTLCILPCTWLQVVQDTIVWCYHISAHNYHCPHSYQINNKMMHHICLLTTNWNTTHITICNHQKFPNIKKNLHNRLVYSGVSYHKNISQTPNISNLVHSWIGFKIYKKKTN
jgi:hypothetical protein